MRFAALQRIRECGGNYLSRSRRTPAAVFSLSSSSSTRQCHILSACQGTIVARGRAALLSGKRRILTAARIHRPLTSVSLLSTTSNHEDATWTALWMAAAAALCFVTTFVDAGSSDTKSNNNRNSSTRSNIACCEEAEAPPPPPSAATSGWTPSSVSDDDVFQLAAEHDIETLPIYTSDQVAENDGSDGKPVWMTYGGIVYDVTDFVPNHPGGMDKIIMAAGSSIEPFWHLYRQHFASDLPMRLMEHMAIGRLSEEDQAAIDEQMATLGEADDPYSNEPLRHRALFVHAEHPMNAEVPSGHLLKSYLTPTSLFYIRHHHPVPLLSDKQLHDFRLQVDISEYQPDKPPLLISLEELKKLPKTEIVATLQCSGNRRSGFNARARTSGTPWGQGAISTAKFGGVRLRTVLEAAGVADFAEAQDDRGMHHVRFTALDGMSASIDYAKATNPYGDVLVCYEMNDQPLPRDHGFPLRIIVPGYAAVRNVKWVERIQLSATEAEGPWQRGLNYKMLPPSVTDANEVQMDKIPTILEASLYSGIVEMDCQSEQQLHPGDRATMTVRGWAWAGGGRNIQRVDLTGDDGLTWHTASLQQGAQQRYGRAWAWTFWECTVPAVVHEDGCVRVASKAVDMANNVQPEKSDPQWNVRGLNNNSWYRVQKKVAHW